MGMSHKCLNDGHYYVKYPQIANGRTDRAHAAGLSGGRSNCERALETIKTAVVALALRLAQTVHRASA
jgi:hypothetical protein